MSRLISGSASNASCQRWLGTRTPSWWCRFLIRSSCVKLISCERSDQKMKKIERQIKKWCVEIFFCKFRTIICILNGSVRCLFGFTALSRTKVKQHGHYIFLIYSVRLLIKVLIKHLDRFLSTVYHIKSVRKHNQNQYIRCTEFCVVHPVVKGFVVLF